MWARPPRASSQVPDSRCSAASTVLATGCPPAMEGRGSSQGLATLLLLSPSPEPLGSPDPGPRGPNAFTLPRT